MLTSQRLTYRRPEASDARQIFDLYASDAEVTRYLSWPRHVTIAETEAFIDFSDAEWARWQTGPLLIESDSALLGSTGLSLETPFRASTGYCLAQRAWGKGYATEALQRMVTLASELGVWRLEAICHHEHEASARVLTKCGFTQEAYLEKHTLFPNHDAMAPADVLLFGRVLRD